MFHKLQFHEIDLAPGEEIVVDKQTNYEGQISSSQEEALTAANQ